MKYKKLLIIYSIILIVYTAIILIPNKFKYNKRDVYLILYHIKYEFELPEELQEIYDVNNDGVVNIIDAVKIINMIKDK